jgi:hypothetical protein
VVFGRGRQRKADEEAVREQERRALFEELAKRPDTVCPFLGLAQARTQYHDGVSDEHRCYAFGDPAELSSEQQSRVCLERGYGNCPRYLRGVLVIPTEELEALRRPQEPRPPPPPPPPPAAAASGGGRRGLLAVLLVLLLAAGVGIVGFVILENDGGVATPTATPTPAATAPTTPGPSGSVAPSASGEPSPTPVPTPIVLPSSSAGEIPPLPTPGPDDESTGFAVFVTEGEYPVVRLDDEGNVIGEATAVFSRVSAAPVERVVVDDTIYWRTLLGDYVGLAYSRSLSDDFFIYETYQTADGEARFRRLGEDEL